MKLRKKQQGQGMVELLLLTSLLGVTFWLSVSQLNHALNEQHEQLDSIRADMFQPVPQPTWQRHPGDQFSQQVGRVLRPMQQYTQLNVALDNLYSVYNGSLPFPNHLLQSSLKSTINIHWRVWSTVGKRSMQVI